MRFYTKHHDPLAYALLQTILGIGKILGLVILYEIENINRFLTVQDFTSYCRLVKSVKESGGKKYGTSGKKIGNAHLKWAFSEAAALFLKGNEPGKKYLDRLTNKHGKGKALSILAHKMGRAVYFMLKNRKAFDQNKFLGLAWRGRISLTSNWNHIACEHVFASNRGQESPCVKKRSADDMTRLIRIPRA